MSILETRRDGQDKPAKPDDRPVPQNTTRRSRPAQEAWRRQCSVQIIESGLVPFACKQHGCGQRSSGRITTSSSQARQSKPHSPRSARQRQSPQEFQMREILHVRWKWLIMHGYLHYSLTCGSHKHWCIPPLVPADPRARPRMFHITKCITCFVA